MIKAIVPGAAGRMGSLLIRTIHDTEGITLAGASEKPGLRIIGEDAGLVAGVGPLQVKITDNLESVIDQGEVLIDFTTPEATRRHLAIACKHKISMVIGTTALPDDLTEEIRQLSCEVPVVSAPNMSVGVNLLFSLLPQLVHVLERDFDIEIVEAHHRFKKDAPSGTAMKMAQIIAQARGLRLEEAAQYGREGLPGERKADEIGIHAVRAGDIVGDHTVIFGGLGERLEVTHRAHSRETFARGAVRAALFLAKKAPGLYTMQDVLGL